MSGPGVELARRAEVAAKCRSCGTCRSVCPIFAEVGIESAAARGKVALIKAVLEGELELSQIFDERIQLCLNCKTCVRECPNEVRVDDLILAARSGLVEAGRLSFLKRLAFRMLLRRGRLLPPVGKFAAFIQRRVLRGLPADSALRRLLPAVGIDRDRVFPQFASRSFIETTPEVVPARSSPGLAVEAGAGEGERIAREARRVAYFVGCATNLIYPGTGRSITDVLASTGVEVVIPRAQGCCGTPVLNAGDFTTARAMAESNIEVLKATGADAIVTGCASCGLTLKREYAELLGIGGGVGIPVFDFTEFLVLRGWRPSGEFTGEKIRVAYHDPCHLARGQLVSEEPRELLRSLPWVEFVEMRDADRCCGGGGTFSLTHYDLAKAIGRHKVESIRDVGVDVVATECQVCTMQLRDMLAQAGVDVAVVSVADVVAQGCGESPPPGAVSV